MIFIFVILSVCPELDVLAVSVEVGHRSLSIMIARSYESLGKVSKVESIGKSLSYQLDYFVFRDSCKRHKRSYMG